MVICHIISGDLWAGAEVMCHRLIKGLQENNNFHISVILFNERKLAAELRKLGINLYVVDETRLGYYYLIKKIHRILMELNPDIIHTHGLKENITAYLSSIYNRKHIRLLCTQHGAGEPNIRAKRKLLLKINDYILSRRFHSVIAVSDDLRDILFENRGFPYEKLVVIRNGTEVPPHPKEINDRDPFVIGSAGRLFPIKDYPFLVDIAAEIFKHAQNIRFELAGDGPEREEIIKRIKIYGLEKVFTLKGFTEDMNEFYMGLDLYVNTSMHEGFPMSVLEAMAHGLPVVAPREGGLKEIIEDGEVGFLVDGREPNRFAVKCMEIYKDRNLRLKMGRASREKILKEYSISKMAEKYIKLYNIAVNSG